MDISSLVSKAVAAIKGDKSLLTAFTADPAKALEGILGQLPTDTLNKVIEGVKKALGGEAEGFLAKIKKFFAKLTGK
ncbi:MAG: hypothetical protein IKY06_04695 [Clostridia bacterium]|nr:hypothetical protein [Clostridia bacterium]MBR5009921.1 hypothetical protein [Clostridia bacterium]MBR5258663.1 hypothetical protein [Clostridia bacterium]MBR6008033.1 hypothetical protein [Clostridia bacterium]